MTLSRLFVRWRFVAGWTVGCDVRNGALLQFTKTIPATGRHRIINLLVFAYRESFKDISNAETRIHVNLGWKQGLAWLWL